MEEALADALDPAFAAKPSAAETKDDVHSIRRA
jgi:hypothetical protein